MCCCGSCSFFLSCFCVLLSVWNWVFMGKWCVIRVVCRLCCSSINICFCFVLFRMIVRLLWYVWFSSCGSVLGRVV